MPAQDFLNRPMMDAPDGQTSNVEHPYNEAGLMYATLGFALATVTLFTWFRFLVKLLILDKLHLEDYMIPVAWATAVVHIVCGFMMADLAPIIHSWDITLGDFGHFLKWFRISSIFYNLSIVLIKIAMLVQVMRIFVPRGSQSKTYWVLHALIWSNVAYYTITIFMMMFNCRPIHKAWMPWLPGSCLNIGAIAVSTAAFNLLGDLSILFLTQRAIWRLMRVDPRARVKLAGVFMAGIVPCGFAIMCLYYNNKQIRFTDFTRDSMYMSIACYGEVASGMFVLFLPMVPKFLSHMKNSSPLFSASHRRLRSGLEFSDVGAAPGSKGTGAPSQGEMQRKKSLFHISYTQREGSGSESEEALGMGMGINVTSSVSVRSERLEEEDVERGEGRARGCGN